MALIDWNDNLSVGIGVIDQQHKQLIAIINELNDAMKAGKSKDVLNSIIVKLIQYTQMHFATEEKYFAQFNYPETEPHKAQHAQFVQKVSDFKKKFDETQIGLSVEIMNFLCDWLKTHIQGTDKKYTACFTAGGLK